jgi:hypothetical protein
MDLFMLQEFVAVLLVLAALAGTILVMGIALILFREGIRRAVHARQTHFLSLRGVSAKDHWLRAHGRSILR